MAANNNNKAVPEARQALNNMKYEIANQVGVNMQQGYNGQMTTKEAGQIGGQMVKKMIEAQERSMSGR